MEINMRAIKICRVLAVFSLAVISGCTASTFKSETVSKESTIADYTFTYESPIENVVQFVYESANDLGWSKDEEHRDIFGQTEKGSFQWEIMTRNTSFSKYKYAWRAVAPKSRVDDLVLIRVRTPMSAFSFGAHIYIGVSSVDEKTTVRYSGSTSQHFEKKNLRGYIGRLANAVKEKLVKPEI